MIIEEEEDELNIARETTNVRVAMDSGATKSVIHLTALSSGVCHRPECQWKALFRCWRRDDGAVRRLHSNHDHKSRGRPRLKLERGGRCQADRACGSIHGTTRLFVEQQAMRGGRIWNGPTLVTGYQIRCEIQKKQQHIFR